MKKWDRFVKLDLFVSGFYHKRFYFLILSIPFHQYLIKLWRYRNVSYSLQESRMERTYPIRTWIYYYMPTVYLFYLYFYSEFYVEFRIKAENIVTTYFILTYLCSFMTFTLVEFLTLHQQYKETRKRKVGV
jgi:hypothetical protein